MEDDTDLYAASHPLEEDQDSDVEIVMDTTTDAINAPTTSSLVHLVPDGSAQQQRTTDMMHKTQQQQQQDGSGGITAPPVNLDTPGTFQGKSIYAIDIDALHERPWRKPGADIADYFNYGFDEQTWRMYCMKQKMLRDEWVQVKERSFEAMKQDGVMLPENMGGVRSMGVFGGQGGRSGMVGHAMGGVGRGMGMMGQGGMVSGGGYAGRMPSSSAMMMMTQGMPMGMPSGPVGSVMPTGPRGPSSGVTGGGYVPVDRDRKRDYDDSDEYGRSKRRG